MTSTDAGAERSKPRRLGRGLSSLVGDPVSVRAPDEASKQILASEGDQASDAPATDANEPSDADRSRESAGVQEASSNDARGLRHVAIDQIDPSPYQARESFDEGAIGGLAQSIRRSGLMQPIVVRPRNSGRFELVAGERRWRAARAAGLKEIPVVVRELTDEESAELGVVENVQREDLNPIERARAFGILATTFGLTHAEIADRVGLERPSVSNFVRMLDLENDIQDLLAHGELSSGHAKALLSLEPGSRRISLAKTAARDSWSVRRLETEAARMRGPRSQESGGGASAASHLDDLERQLSEHLGTKVRVRTDSSGTRGRMEISFYDLDHFDGLMSRLGFKMS